MLVTFGGMEVHKLGWLLCNWNRVPWAQVSPPGGKKRDFMEVGRTIFSIAIKIKETFLLLLGEQSNVLCLIQHKTFCARADIMLFGSDDRVRHIMDIL